MGNEGLVKLLIVDRGNGFESTAHSLSWLPLSRLPLLALPSATNAREIEQQYNL
jgi:hypothetical protein